MRIGIDARFITRRPRRGIGNYSLHVVSALIKLYPEAQFILYISIPDSEGILPSGSNVTVRQLKMPLYPLWEQLALALAARRDGLDILHCMGNTAPLFMPASVHLILTLHDAMFLQSGDFVPTPTNRYQAWGKRYRSFVAPLCARKSSHVLAVSEFSRQDILALIPGLDPARVHVTYNSYDPLFQHLSTRTEEPEQSTVKPAYIFALGADDPRKNIKRLVTAYLQLIAENNGLPDLIISGYARWEQSDAYRLVKDAGATSRVKFLGFIDIEELVALYRGASLFVYPSLYEGFGIPILEAFSSGCPVIASNVTSIPEVGGDAALYVDPLSVEHIKTAVLQVLQDDALRDTLVQKGHMRALQFTWEEAAHQTFTIYEACLKKTTI